MLKYCHFIKNLLQMLHDVPIFVVLLVTVTPQLYMEIESTAETGIKTTWLLCKSGTTAP